MSVDLRQQCGCGCRPTMLLANGCPCRECQPGPGIDHMTHTSRREQVHRARLRELLAKDDLSEAEAEELDERLAWHVYR